MLSEFCCCEAPYGCELGAVIPNICMSYEDMSKGKCSNCVNVLRGNVSYDEQTQSRKSAVVTTQVVVEVSCGSRMLANVLDDFELMNLL